jgi:hypothetical protein
MDFSKQQAFNYAETLKAAIKDVEEFREAKQRKKLEDNKNEQN